MRILIIAAILLPQDASPVLTLLGRIDGKDPAACFRAIADLADLDARHRPEIEKGAGTLPSFYRDALLAELKLNASTPRRVNLDGKERTVRGHLEELQRNSDLKVDLKLWGPRDGEDILARKAGSVSGKDVPPLEALALICEKGRFQVEQGLLSDSLRVTRTNSKVRTFGHRSAAFFHQYRWIRKWIDFSNKPEWTAHLQFDAVLGAGALVWEWKDVRVIEAVGEKGVDLRLDPARRPDTAVDTPEGPTEPSFWLDSGFLVNLRLPDGVTAVERLKFTAVARIATGFKSFELKELAADGSGKVSKDGFELEVRQHKASEMFHCHYLLRVRSTTLPLEELVRRPVMTDADCSGWKGGRIASGRIVAGAVEYELDCTPDISSGPASQGEDEKVVLKEVRVQLADALEERTVYTEFRELPLK